MENTKDGYEILKVGVYGSSYLCMIANINLFCCQVSRDELASGSTTLPSVLKDDIKLLESFLAESNIITKTMLACLSNAIGLKDLDRFESFHRNDHKSNSTLALLHYIPTELTGQCVGHRKHTDVGSLTLLFSEQWGLQVIPTGNSSWEFVAPRPGHAIVNVGDSLRFASGNSFNSCIHQVVPMDRAENRYSIAYFLRPESEKDFKDSEGRRVTASQWHDEKYEVFGQTYSEQAANTILTGGM